MSAAILSPSAPSGAVSFTRAAGTVIRALAALGIAAAVTFALFSVMQVLIATDEAPPAAVPAQPDITISFQPPEIETVRPPREFAVEPVSPPPDRRRLVVDVQPRPVEGAIKPKFPRSIIPWSWRTWVRSPCRLRRSMCVLSPAIRALS